MCISRWRSKADGTASQTDRSFTQYTVHHELVALVSVQTATHTHTQSPTVWKCNKQNPSLRLYVGMSAIRLVLLICCCDAHADVPDAAFRSIYQTHDNWRLFIIRPVGPSSRPLFNYPPERPHPLPFGYSLSDASYGHRSGPAADAAPRDPAVLRYDICSRAAQYGGYMRPYDDPGAAVTLHVEIVR